MREGDDVQRRVDEISAGSFGRAETLSGQLSGQVGRVFCHERVLSEFTERLLETLETGGAAGEPLALIDREASRTLRPADVRDRNFASAPANLAWRLSSVELLPCASSASHDGLPGPVHHRSSSDEQRIMASAWSHRSELFSYASL